MEIGDKRRELDRLTAEQAELAQQIEAKRIQLATLRQNVIDLEDTVSLQEEGLYNYSTPAEDSVSLGEQLKANRERQRRMVKDKTAVLTNATNFTFDNSLTKGRRFTDDMRNMALSLYNAEAENCVKNTKAGNLESSRKRLEKCADRIRRFGNLIGLAVSVDYQRLRVEELRLTSLYLQALQAEKEAERAHREELREQAKAQKEIEAQSAKLRKEREHYATALEAVRANGDIQKIAELESKLNAVDKSIKDMDFRAANTRAGYVYVVSDIGAFGEHVVKIGMTRRLDPLDRIRELSSASVPFPFDIHALFFADDAVGLETALHHDFDDRRVNRVNMRKEFFRCSPEEVLAKLKEHNAAVVEFKIQPEADEYRRTLALEHASNPS